MDRKNGEHPGRAEREGRLRTTEDLQPDSLLIGFLLLPTRLRGLESRTRPENESKSSRRAVVNNSPYPDTQ